MQFEITPAQHGKINEWLKDVVYPPVIERQKEHAAKYPGSSPVGIMKLCWEEGHPYEGASGGGLTYEFTPTSIGLVVKVKAYDQVLDLTDYGSW